VRRRGWLSGRGLAETLLERERACCERSQGVGDDAVRLDVVVAMRSRTSETASKMAVRMRSKANGIGLVGCERLRERLLLFRQCELGLTQQRGARTWLTKLW
jgi:hypothetical protein